MRRVDTAPGTEALTLDRHTVKVLCECYIGTPVPPYPTILPSCPPLAPRSFSHPLSAVPPPNSDASRFYDQPVRAEQLVTTNITLAGQRSGRSLIFPQLNGPRKILNQYPNLTSCGVPRQQPGYNNHKPAYHPRL